MTQTSFGDNYLGLDVGSKRIGVALASAVAKIPQPHKTIANGDDIWQQLQSICESAAIGTVVVGLPRGLEGQETSQTAYCRDFAAELARKLPVQVVLQDEALTSVQAEAMLSQRKRQFDKGEIDAMAAAFILGDYLQEQNV